ncbi:Long-chain-fatty-acid--CoA ligase 5 [Trichinella patagoniensis]|uniref:Long-chain-fatty-acid--CoA ligase n=1 Tax=Trichinella patagoniensis TaxID=990121 RepID=A0A0V0ZX22_9BILA|nr:Long-chain-fatty-acid--CoA ligase 5 [Trichinella patagoniensis]
MRTESTMARFAVLLLLLLYKQGSMNAEETTCPFETRRVVYGYRFHSCFTLVTDISMPWVRTVDDAQEHCKKHFKNGELAVFTAISKQIAEPSTWTPNNVNLKILNGGKLRLKKINPLHSGTVRYKFEMFTSNETGNIYTFNRMNSVNENNTWTMIVPEFKLLRYDKNLENILNTENIGKDICTTIVKSYNKNDFSVGQSFLCNGEESRSHWNSIICMHDPYANCLLQNVVKCETVSPQECILVNGVEIAKNATEPYGKQCTMNGAVKTPYKIDCPCKFDKIVCMNKRNNSAQSISYDDEFCECPLQYCKYDPTCNSTPKKCKINKSNGTFECLCMPLLDQKVINKNTTEPQVEEKKFEKVLNSTTYTSTNATNKDNGMERQETTLANIDNSSTVTTSSTATATHTASINSVSQTNITESRLEGFYIYSLLSLKSKDISHNLPSNNDQWAYLENSGVVILSDLIDSIETQHPTTFTSLNTLNRMTLENNTVVTNRCGYVQLQGNATNEYEEGYYHIEGKLNDENIAFYLIKSTANEPNACGQNFDKRKVILYVNGFARIKPFSTATVKTEEEETEGPMYTIAFSGKLHVQRKNKNKKKKKKKKKSKKNKKQEYEQYENGNSSQREEMLCENLNSDKAFEFITSPNDQMKDYDNYSKTIQSYHTIYQKNAKFSISPTAISTETESTKTSDLMSDRKSIVTSNSKTDTDTNETETAAETDEDSESNEDSISTQTGEQSTSSNYDSDQSKQSINNDETKANCSEIEQIFPEIKICPQNEKAQNSRSEVIKCVTGAWALVTDGHQLTFLTEYSAFTLPLIIMMVFGGAMTYFGLNSSSRKVKPACDLNDQTSIVSEFENSRSSKFIENGQVLEYLSDDCRTMYDVLRQGAKASNNGPCLGYRKKMPDNSRPYVWMNFNDVIRRCNNLAQGLLSLGLKPGGESFVGLYSINRPEWTIAEHACYAYSMVVVPLYDTLGKEAVSYIIEQTEMKVIICDTAKRAQSLIEIAPKHPQLRHVIIMDSFDDQLAEKAKANGIEFIRYNAVELEGATVVNPLPHVIPRPNDLATICYTSGTTGLPKGVMLSHGNIIANSTVQIMFKNEPVCSSDILISFLPLAHMFERLMELCVLMLGGCVGYYSGDIRQITDDMKALKPTLFPMVPRLLNRIYDKVTTEVNKNVFKKIIFQLAMNSKMRDLEKSILRRNTLLDRLVFKKVREEIGGNVRIIVSGSAPASPAVLTFVRAAFSCTVLEGYGQTECVAAACLTLEGDHVAGHVGPPSPSCIIKLVDVPDMNYFAKNNQGEVCIKGPNVFHGYYKDPERTREALDEDGWLHTGDIGEWTSRGTLKLIDRKKNIFKLAQGEYIAPEKVENVYLKSKFVSQIFVHGDSLKSCLVGIVVPNIPLLEKHVSETLNLRQKPEELLKNAAVKRIILDDMLNEGKLANLCSFEQVKDIYLHGDAFSVENNLLTPTYKARRTEICKQFQERIAEMYKHLC